MESGQSFSGSVAANGKRVSLVVGTIAIKKSGCCRMQQPLCFLLSGEPDAEDLLIAAAAEDEHVVEHGDL